MSCGIFRDPSSEYAFNVVKNQIKRHSYNLVCRKIFQHIQEHSCTQNHGSRTVEGRWNHAGTIRIHRGSSKKAKHIRLVPRQRIAFEKENNLKSRNLTCYVSTFG